MPHYLPTKILSYLIRLQAEYAANDMVLENEIITHCRAWVEEETAYDNWNGGTYGHDVLLYLPLDLLTKIGLANEEQVASNICQDLNKLSRQVQNESFNAVHFELNDDEDVKYQAGTVVSAKPPLDPDLLPFWKPGMVRLFISHKDKHKAKTNELARALLDFGVSSFVAHDTIQPMSEWRKEIIKGLETMEIMLVYLTDDFHDSTFTNQEVGYALGANKPVVSLKLGKNDPPGFISHEQALRGNIDDATACAKALYPLLAKALGKKERLDDSLISAFLASTNFNDSRDRFDHMASVVPKLNAKQLASIIEGFRGNDQLHNAGHLVSKYERLRHYLERATGKEFNIEGRVIAEIKRPALRTIDDDVPF